MARKTSTALTNGNHVIDVRDLEDRSLGELVSQATADISTLARKEVELAKAEIAAEVAKVGKGVGFLGGSAFFGHMAWLFASLAAMFGLAAWMPLGSAAFTVAVVYGAVAGLLVLRGKKALSTLDPTPRRTIKTLKEDAAWARHPTS